MPDPMNGISFLRSGIDVWSIPLRSSKYVRRYLIDMLSDDERLRADRFHFDHHRWEFVVGRGILRILISRYLDIPAADIRFTYSDTGKPEIRKVRNVSDEILQFNLSHSEGIAVYAFTLGREIGVDLERIRPFPALERIALDNFSMEEYQELLSVDKEQRDQAFYRCWTRREAYLKAIGTGLVGPLKNVRVSFRPGTEPELSRGIDSVGGKWLLRSLDIHPQYAASIAYSAPEVRVTARHIKNLSKAGLISILQSKWWVVDLAAQDAV
jgi:4'-phosphopantetheinyl transferase